jgi:hypothetical protein
MTMVKQRRSFFVDDILHMVMPMNKNTNYSNEINDRKRKRSIIPEHDNREDDDSIGEDLSNKKFRSYNHEDKDDDEEEDEDEDEDDNDESKHSQIVDVLRDGGTGEESSISDNSNSVGNNSGKLRHIEQFLLTTKLLIE